MANATITVTNSNDSFLISNTIAHKNGDFFFNDLADGDYGAFVYSQGYETVYKRFSLSAKAFHVIGKNNDE